MNDQSKPAVGWTERRIIDHIGHVPHGLTAAGEAERDRVEAQERERIQALGRDTSETTFVGVDHGVDTTNLSQDQVRMAVAALQEKLGPRPPTRDFRIPEVLAGYMFVDETNFVRFTPRGRDWLGELQGLTTLILCLPRGIFDASLLVQVQAYDEIVALSGEEIRDAFVAEHGHRFRRFDAIWTKARRAELLELLPLLCHLRPELEDLGIEWISGLLAASVTPTKVRAERKALTKAERNRNNSARKAQRSARKVGRHE
jgi:hypothetical protein